MGFNAELVNELDVVGNWGLVTTDTELKITSWNAWLERSTGNPASAVLGCPLFDVFPEILRRKLDHYYHQALQGQTVVLSQALHKYVILLPAPASEKRFDCMQQS